MIDKSRAVEAQMRESQKHTKLLKKNLEHARKAAEQDHLTGLPNRRAFESTLREEAVRARDKGKSLSVAFCDIDHFTQINDVHGHDDKCNSFVTGHGVTDSVVLGGRRFSQKTKKNK